MIGQEHDKSLAIAEKVETDPTSQAIVDDQLFEQNVIRFLLCACSNLIVDDRSLKNRCMEIALKVVLISPLLTLSLISHEKETCFDKL